MTELTGTFALVRLALRLDRVRLPIWVLGLAVMPVGTAGQYMKLYPTDESIRRISGVVTNPSLVALNGPLFRATLGGLTAWKILATELILVSLMSVLTVVRHTRADEEAGRLELVRAGAVGRRAPLVAALVTAGLANVAVTILTALGLAGAGLPLSGSVALGAAIGATGLIFATVAAVAAQLTESARSATAIAAAVLGASYLLRAAGDTGPAWAAWASPLGWAIRMRAFAGERWGVLALAVGLAAVLLGVAVTLAGHRDLGAGLVQQRPGRAEAAPGLRSPIALAWRLQRGILFGWLAGMVLWGFSLGGAADGIGAAIGKNEAVSELLARMGGSKGLVDAYLAAVLGITGLVVAAYAIQATLRLRAEETSGRLEPVLATRAGRVQWAISHLSIAVLGTAALLAVAGGSAGLAYGLRIHDVGGQFPRLLGGALVQSPAAWLLAGLGVALFGLAPRLVTLTWASLIACVVLAEAGALFGLSQWLVDASPFTHVPKLPGAAFAVTPVAWLTVLAAGLTAAGLAGFRRRDIG